MRYRYFIVDVFTDMRFGGNPLAVLPDARGLSDTQMQQIAREFNFSESTFVLPPEADGDRRVRIFTPSVEVPFAGHPNVGTAYALAQDGAFGEVGDGLRVVFEEDAGPVPVELRIDDGGRLRAELEAPEPLSLGEAVPREIVARALNLGEAEILEDTHPPRVASVGLPFLVTELSSVAVLRRARVDVPTLESLREQGIVPDLLVYVRSNDEFDIRARMFAPLDGVPEDPATGSANCALVAMLAHADASGGTDLSWRIAQGVEMGRPSVLEARCRKDGDAVRTWIGGHAVLLSEGWIEAG